MLAAVLLLVIVQEPARFESREHGITLTAPAADWIVETQDAAGARLVVVIRPSDAALAPLGGVGAAQARIEVLDSAASPAELRDATFAQAGTLAEASDAERLELEIAGGQAPGLGLHYAQGGVKYVLRQYFVATEVRIIRLQIHAPASHWEEFRPALEACAQSLELLAPDPSLDSERRLRALARRCGSELEWAPDWAAAAARARADRKLILVAVQSYGGFDVGDLLGTGPFMDPDVVALARTRFVPFRFRVGMDAPFAAPERYGMSPTTFGLALLLATPDGEIVRETFATDAAIVARFLREALRGHPQLAGPPPPPADAGPAARISWLQSCGDLAEADAAIASLEAEGGDRVAIHRARAEQHRLRLRGGDALAELQEAAALAKDDPLALAALEESRAIVLAGLGRLAEAGAAWQRAASLAPQTPRARWWLGLLALARGASEEARQAWLALAAEDPEDRWSWWAAGMATHPLLERMSGASPAWPSEEEMALAFPSAPGPLPRSEAARAETEARAWLLAEQRADGSWPTPSEIGQTEHERERNRFLQANAALGGWALLTDERDAAARALEWLLESFEREREREPEARREFMDYTPWSAAYALHFFAAAREAGLGDPDRVRAAADQAIAQLAARQKANGGWSYYLSPSLAGSLRPSAQAISFTTATVVLALQHAGRAGAALPEGVLEAGLASLEAMREPSGIFSYFLEADGSLARATGVPGAAGRGPVCCLPLLRAGREDADALRRRFALWSAHLPELAREQGKALMHAGADAQGSHYLLYDYAMAAIAARELPAAERGALRGPILDALLAARCADGSFLDNPSVGRHAATALALLAFAAARD